MKKTQLLKAMGLCLLVGGIGNANASGNLDLIHQVKKQVGTDLNKTKIMNFTIYNEECGIKKDMSNVDGIKIEYPGGLGVLPNVVRIKVKPAKTVKHEDFLHLIKSAPQKLIITKNRKAYPLKDNNPFPFEHFMSQLNDEPFSVALEKLHTQFPWTQNKRVRSISISDIYNQNISASDSYYKFGVENGDGTCSDFVYRYLEGVIENPFTQSKCLKLTGK